jgi:4-hydroxy-tetrahydrodipicolinate reductase
MIRIAVGGSKGRMGQRVIALAAGDPRLEVVARYDIEEAVGSDAFDVLIDFATPAASAGFIDRCLKARAGLVVGTTGHDADQLSAIKRAATEIPVLRAANFSIGVNMLLDLLPEMARRLSPGFDVEIVETHHRRKVDAPSGTALAMLEALLGGPERARGAAVKHGRQGQVGAKPPDQIGIHAVRSGDVVGRHEIIFGGVGESITVTHEALSRDTFAHGALEAACWLCGRPAGLYSMQDVLSLAAARPATG